MSSEAQAQGTGTGRRLCAAECSGWLLMLVLLLAICPWAYYRVVSLGSSDFPRFHAAGKYVLEHGQRQAGTILAYYLPSLDVAWAALGWLPLGTAAVVWYGFMSLCWLALLRATARYVVPNAPPTRRRQAALAAGLLVLPLVLGHLCLGAFHILMLLWLVSGLGRVAAGRWTSGGILLGLAVWIKLLPGLAVGYLFWKGKWKPAVLALLTAVAVDVGLSLAAFGPRSAYDEHRSWWRSQARGATARTLVGPEQGPEHRSRNQSLAAVLRRTLTATSVLEADGTIRCFALADFPLALVRRIHPAALGLLGLGLLYVFRRRPRQMTPADWGLEIALLTLATIWFSPIVWSYHATAALPALTLLITRHGRRPLRISLFLGIWVLGMALLGSDQARAHGEMYWCSWCLGGALLWAARLKPIDALDEEQPAAAATETSRAAAA